MRTPCATGWSNHFEYRIHYQTGSENKGEIPDDIDAFGYALNRAFHETTKDSNPIFRSYC